MKIPFWGQPPDQNCFDDSIYWEVQQQQQHIQISEWCMISVKAFGLLILIVFDMQVPEEEEENEEHLAHADYSKNKTEA